MVQKRRRETAIGAVADGQDLLDTIAVGAGSRSADEEEEEDDSSSAVIKHADMGTSDSDTFDVHAFNPPPRSSIVSLHMAENGKMVAMLETPRAGDATGTNVDEELLEWEESDSVGGGTDQRRQRRRVLVVGVENESEEVQSVGGNASFLRGQQSSTSGGGDALKSGQNVAAGTETQRQPSPRQHHHHHQASVVSSNSNPPRPNPASSEQDEYAAPSLHPAPPLTVLPSTSFPSESSLTSDSSFLSNLILSMRKSLVRLFKCQDALLFTTEANRSKIVESYNQILNELMDHVNVLDSRQQFYIEKLLLYSQHMKQKDELLVQRGKREEFEVKRMRRLMEMEREKVHRMCEQIETLMRRSVVVNENGAANEGADIAFTSPTMMAKKHEQQLEQIRHELVQITEHQGDLKFESTVSTTDKIPKRSHLRRKLEDSATLNQRYNQLEQDNMNSVQDTRRVLSNAYDEALIDMIKVKLSEVEFKKIEQLLKEELTKKEEYSKTTQEGSVEARNQVVVDQDESGGDDAQPLQPVATEDKVPVIPPLAPPQPNVPTVVEKQMQTDAELLKFLDQVSNGAIAMIHEVGTQTIEPGLMCLDSVPVDFSTDSLTVEDFLHQPADEIVQNNKRSKKKQLFSSSSSQNTPAKSTNSGGTFSSRKRKVSISSNTTTDKPKKRQNEHPISHTKSDSKRRLKTHSHTPLSTADRFSPRIGELTSFSTHTPDGDQFGIVDFVGVSANAEVEKPAGGSSSNIRPGATTSTQSSLTHKPQKNSDPITPLRTGIPTVDSPSRTRRKLESALELAGAEPEEERGKMQVSQQENTPPPSTPQLVEKEKEHNRELHQENVDLSQQDKDKSLLPPTSKVVGDLPHEDDSQTNNSAHLPRETLPNPSNTLLPTKLLSHPSHTTSLHRSKSRAKRAASLVQSKRDSIPIEPSSTSLTSENSLTTPHEHKNPSMKSPSSKKSRLKKRTSGAKKASRRNAGGATKYRRGNSSSHPSSKSSPLESLDFVDDLARDTFTSWNDDHARLQLLEQDELDLDLGSRQDSIASSKSSTPGRTVKRKQNSSSHSNTPSKGGTLTTTGNLQLAMTTTISAPTTAHRARSRNESRPRNNQAFSEIQLDRIVDKLIADSAVGKKESKSLVILEGLFDKISSCLHNRAKSERKQLLHESAAMAAAVGKQIEAAEVMSEREAATETKGNTTEMELKECTTVKPLLVGDDELMGGGWEMHRDEDEEGSGVGSDDAELSEVDQGLTGTDTETGTPPRDSHHSHGQQQDNMIVSGISLGGMQQEVVHSNMTLDGGEITATTIAAIESPRVRSGVGSGYARRSSFRSNREMGSSLGLTESAGGSARPPHHTIPTAKRKLHTSSEATRTRTRHRQLGNMKEKEMGLERPQEQPMLLGSEPWSDLEDKESDAVEEVTGNNSQSGSHSANIHFAAKPPSHSHIKNRNHLSRSKPSTAPHQLSTDTSIPPDDICVILPREDPSIQIIFNQSRRTRARQKNPSPPHTPYSARYRIASIEELEKAASKENLEQSPLHGLDIPERILDLPPSEHDRLKRSTSVQQLMFTPYSGLGSGFGGSMVAGMGVSRQQVDTTSMDEPHHRNPKPPHQMPVHTFSFSEQKRDVTLLQHRGEVSLSKSGQTPQKSSLVNTTEITPLSRPNGDTPRLRKKYIQLRGKEKTFIESYKMRRHSLQQKEHMLHGVTAQSTPRFGGSNKLPKLGLLDGNELASAGTTPER
eukprot:CAMPEP_0117447638 /NCGR_PEP_ID=MMETSP0759-20121206/6981_1 /TAXON_ID=63605 /ORGANISM="Percolomonas cosmopolitus, Strain WS" /LENGTH=1726 /DNA_ID=CAMNT_0005239985 /DNA_START=168 /DNA_END=5347 /DNA_ORIENTATION=+